MDENRHGNIVYGRNPVLEVIKGGRDIEKLYVAKGNKEGSIIKIIALAREKRIPVSETDNKKLAEMAGSAAHQGVAACITMKDYCSLSDILKIAEDKGKPPFILIADGITDVHNLGALIRTAESAGIDGLIIPERGSAFINETVYKTSAGACEHLAVAKVSSIPKAIDALKDAGVWIYGTEGEGTADIYSADLTGSAAFVIGSEGFGMSRLVKEKCDFLLSIPMHGKINSLNASVAGAVVIYEALRQRKAKGE